MDCSTIKNIWAAVKPNFRLEQNCCDTNGIVCDDSGRITDLDLSYAKCNGSVPEDINQLKQLKSLKLAGNSLRGQLPSFSLMNLKSFDLSNNKLDGCLKPCTIKMPSLERFNISNNLISGQLPNEFRMLTRLQEVDISNTAITGKISNSWSFPNLKVCNVMESICSENASVPSVCGVKSCSERASEPRASPPVISLPSTMIIATATISSILTTATTIASMESIISTETGTAHSPKATHSGHGNASEKEMEAPEHSAVPLTSVNLAGFIALLAVILILVSYISIYVHHKNSNSHNDTESIAEEGLIDEKRDSRKSTNLVDLYNR